MDNGLAGISHFYKNILSDNVIAAIKDEIDNMQADLLVMVPHKYGFGNRLYTEVRQALWHQVIIFHYYRYLFSQYKSD